VPTTPTSRAEQSATTQRPQPDVGENVLFSNLITAYRGKEVPYQLEHQEDLFSISGKFDKICNAHFENLRIRGTKKRLEIIIKKDWSLPKDLKFNMFEDSGERQGTKRP